MRMAMRHWTFPVAALAVVLVGGGLAAAVLRPPPAPPKRAELQLALPVLAAKYRLADRIELVQGAAVLWLERRGQVWGLAEAGGYPVRPEAAAALIDGLMDLQLQQSAPMPTTDGTLVRVLAVSGEVLGTIIVGPEAGVVRKPGAATAWQAAPFLQVSANAADWIDLHLPLPEAAVLDRDGAALRQSLAALRFTAVRASPQIRPSPVRTIQMALSDGTAKLDVGRLAGQDWLHVSGSSAWARGLAPYAFAIPSGSLTP